MGRDPTCTAVGAEQVAGVLPGAGGNAGHADFHGIVWTFPLPGPDVSGDQVDPFAVAVAGHHPGGCGPLGGEGLVQGRLWWAASPRRAQRNSRAAEVEG